MDHWKILCTAKQTYPFSLNMIFQNLISIWQSLTVDLYAIVACLDKQNCVHLATKTIRVHVTPSLLTPSSGVVGQKE